MINLLFSDWQINLYPVARSLLPHQDQGENQNGKSEKIQGLRELNNWRGNKHTKKSKQFIKWCKKNLSSLGDQCPAGI